MSRFIDSLRELLLPVLALTILATLWTLAKARNGEDDLAQGLTAPAPLALREKANHAADDTADEDERSTAQADLAPAGDHR